MQIARKIATWPNWLPYDAEVEYLESDGASYIDTGLNISRDNIDIGLEGRFSCLTNGRYTIIDVKSTSTYSAIEVVTARGSYNYVYVGNGGSTPKTVKVPTLTQPFNVVILQDGKYDVNNGYATGQIEQNRNYSAATDIVLFAYSFNQRITPSAAGVRIYKIRLYRDKAYDLDFISVRIGSVGAMYNRAGVGGMNSDGTARNDGLYFNRGTGAFVIGPDVSASNGGGV